MNISVVAAEPENPNAKKQNFCCTDVQSTERVSMVQVNHIPTEIKQFT